MTDHPDEGPCDDCRGRLELAALMSLLALSFLGGVFFAKRYLGVNVAEAVAD